MTQTYVVTGGAGFVGSNIAKRLAKGGSKVIVVDDLSREGGGSKRNLESLGSYPIEIDLHDVAEDLTPVRLADYDPDVIIHCAAQTSLRRVVDAPFNDFLTNALGTINCLEAAKEAQAHFIYFSTNKVYGNLAQVPIVEEGKRYRGLSTDEKFPVQPHLDPYSVSKTTGDLYSQMYPRTTVLRCSSLYGPGQWPIAGQGWLGVFGLLVASKEKLVLAGNGKQVRDVLHSEDLCDLIELVISREAYGVYNVGGGIENSWSILEYLDLLEELGLGYPEVEYKDWNPWTDKYYVTAPHRITEATGWTPKIQREKVSEYVMQWLLPEVLPHGLTQ